MAGQPEMQVCAREEASGASPLSEGPTVNGSDSRIPRLVHRDGMAYVEGCDVPVWRLEMARRAGAAPAALVKVFPSLTPEGLDLAFAYARQHGDEIDTLIREPGADGCSSLG